MSVLVKCNGLSDVNKSVDDISFAISAVPANGCLYVDNTCNLLVVVLLVNCVSSNDVTKLRDVILSATNATGCLYVDDIPILLVVVLLVNCVASNLFIITALVLFASTFLSTASIKASAVVPFTAIHAAVANAIEPATAIKPVEGIAGTPKFISPGLPSVPSIACKRRFKLVSYNCKLAICVV